MSQSNSDMDDKKKVKALAWPPGPSGGKPPSRDATVMPQQRETSSPERHLVRSAAAAGQRPPSQHAFSSPEGDIGTLTLTSATSAADAAEAASKKAKRKPAESVPAPAPRLSGPRSPYGLPPPSTGEIRRSSNVVEGILDKVLGQGKNEAGPSPPARKSFSERTASGALASCSDLFSHLEEYYHTVLEDGDDGPEYKSRCIYEQACKLLRCLPNTSIKLLLAQQSVNLNNYGLAITSTRALSAALCFNSTCVEILLTGNGLGNAGLEHLAEALLRNKTVRRLDVSRCSVGTGTGMKGGDKAAEAVAAMLRENDVLRALDISHNALGDKLVQVILEGAAVASQRGALAELDLGSTGAGHLCVPSLVAVCRDGQLQRLGISGLNFPGASWEAAIFPALAEAGCLVALDISHNNVAPGAEAALCAAMARCDTLRVVDACGLGLRREGWSAVGSQLVAPGNKVEMLIADVTNGRCVLDQLRAHKCANKKKKAGKGEKEAKVGLRPATLPELRAPGAGVAEDIDIELGPFPDWHSPYNRLTQWNQPPEYPAPAGAKVPSPLKAPQQPLKGCLEHRSEEEESSMRYVPPQRLMAWEGPRWREALAEELQDLARCVTAGARRGESALGLADDAGLWEGTRALDLEQALEATQRSLAWDPLDVGALQKRALASHALNEYHTAAADFLGAMAHSQEDSNMLLGFQQCMEALRVRRARALPDARMLTLRLLHRAARVEEEEEEPPPKLLEEYKGPRRHTRWSPRDDESPPALARLVCDGYEEVLRRVWDQLERHSAGPEWERFRLREYLRDADCDVRAVYDFYRAQPMPGQAQVEAAPRNCTGRFHCRLPHADDGNFSKQYSLCATCKAAGPLRLAQLRRFFRDAKLNTNTLLTPEADRILAAVLAGPAAMGPADGKTPPQPEDNTVREADGPSAEEAAAAGEALRARPHAEKRAIGFYEFAEWLVRVGARQGGATREGVAWVTDRMLTSAVPEFVVQGLLAPPYRAPLEDSRDPISKQLEGNGREGFMAGHFLNLARCFRYFHGTLGGKLAADIFSREGVAYTGEDCVLNFNWVLQMFEKLGLFSPDLTIAKVRRFAVRITGNEEIAPQEHALNNKAEMLFEEWTELMARLAPPPPKGPPKPPAPGRVKLMGVLAGLEKFLDDSVYPTMVRSWPGRW